jgi:hypothetical protein
MAYEKAFGPLGPQYSDYVLACIHEQIQFLSHITGAQYQKNPAPEVNHYPRPDEIFKPAVDKDEDEGMRREDFDAQFAKDNKK